MSQSPPVLPVTQTGSLENLRDGGETAALVLCCAIGILILIPLLFTPFGWWIVLIAAFGIFGRYIMAANIKANGIKVTSEQFPELNAAVEHCRQRLGRPETDVYVIQDSSFNAFATRLAFRNYVVLNSGAVDAVLLKGDAEQLQFLVGHEFGHVQFGHVGFLRGMLPTLGLFIPPLHAWYRRCQERTADRAGLWACGTRAKAQRALSTLAGGAELGPKVNFAAIQTQWTSVSGEFWVMFSRFWSDYPHLTERIVLVDRAANDLGLS